MIDHVIEQSCCLLPGRGLHCAHTMLPLVSTWHDPAAIQPCLTWVKPTCWMVLTVRPMV
jgi:hypothetical protein